MAFDLWMREVPGEIRVKCEALIEQMVYEAASILENPQYDRGTKEFLLLACAAQLRSVRLFAAAFRPSAVKKSRGSRRSAPMGETSNEP